MDLGLKDKIAVVTGGSRGIGKGIAMGLASEGCRLAICARNENGLADSVEEIKKSGVEVFGFAGDITKETDVDRFSEAVLNKFGQVDILINNVGGNKRNLFENTSMQDWQDIMDLNLLSHVKITHSFLPAMKKRQGGVVILYLQYLAENPEGQLFRSIIPQKRLSLVWQKYWQPNLVRKGFG